MKPKYLLPDRADLSTPAHYTAKSCLFIDAQHGLGNRLRSIASAAAIAGATDRHLVVIWKPDHHCEARISDVLRYDGPVVEADVGDVLRSGSEHVYNYMEIEPGAVFQEPILAGVAGNIFVRSAYTLTSPFSNRICEDMFLRQLRPSEAVEDLVHSVVHPSHAAVHIRMGTGPDFDHLAYESPENWPEARHRELMEWRAKSDISRFVTRLDALFAAGEIRTVFAAADLPATYAALIERYGDRVRYLERAQYDRSAAQLQTALADIMLLTASRVFLASNWSSFSDVAQRLARPGRRFEQSGVDF